MDYQAFSIPWTVFTNFGEHSGHSRSGRLSAIGTRPFDADSVCSASPPPSPLSPSPSLVSNDDANAFHFLSAPGDHHGNDGHSGGQVLPYDLCHQVPALLGLTDAQQQQQQQLGRPTPMKGHHHSRSASTGGNNGFYKRLIEWLGRKKKTHRRYSEVWGPSGESSGVRMTARKSAPMIFEQRTVPVVNHHQHAVVTNQKKLLLNSAGGSVSCGSSTTSPTGSIRSDASGSSWAGRLRGRCRTSPNAEQPVIVRVDRGAISENGDWRCESGIETRQHEDEPHETNQLSVRLSVHNDARQPEVPPATPTSCYSVQSGILQFEKQDSTEERGEIDAEWIIPWSDIEVGQVISQRGSCTINRGRWHGDVIIHRFEFQNVDEVSSFWTDVRSLSKLRHENLLLFMGIATDSPTYTIINSAPRGVSVANFRLTIKNGKQERIGMRAAVSISRQVAQATGYLHARGIVHGKLNPHNIFLDGDNYRVKLSLLDHGSTSASYSQFNYGCLPKMQVGYYSPELVRSMIVQPPEVLCSVPSTKFSDVYALGSFIYDLIAGHPPFHQEEIDSVLWRIGIGQTVDLSELNCNTRLKSLIASCWSTDSAQRPTCVEVVRGLSPTALLCKSHSCSEPERLNRLGMCKLAC